MSQFWLDTRIPVSNDLDDWRSLSEDEKDTISKVFGGLTLLDTLQSENAIERLENGARTKHELAVYSNIKMMECIHAKSYSTIFSTLNTKSEIEEVFDWVHNNDYLQRKASMIDYWYQNGNTLQVKVASVFLESFSFYSGFFLPLWYLGNGKMSNVAEIIKLIVRDEGIHGNFIGYKFQKEYENLSEPEKTYIKNWTYNFLMELYNNEVHYAEELYDKLGLTEKVKVFMRYNANKALQNLGFDPLFPDTAEDVDPIVMNGISTGTSNHDFFSQVGNGYLVGDVEAMSDDDYSKWV